MQRNARNPPDPVKTRPSSVGSGGAKKQVRKVPTRKIPYRVGYSWNRGGRLKELRIRHLARKFLKIWMQNTFGRILPHEAKSHYNNVVLRRALEAWRDEWWASRREWRLTLWAECHHRFYLTNWTFRSWQKFVSLQRENKSKVQNAQSFADKQRLRLVWDRWEVFTEMRRMKNRMLESALVQNRCSTLHSAWRFWRNRLRHQRDFNTLEHQALKQRALVLQSRAWLHWIEMHRAARCHGEKESKAVLHFILRLKRRTLHQWMIYVSFRHGKKKTQAVAQRACCLRLVRGCWHKWINALQRKQAEETRLEAAGLMATRSAQRRALRAGLQGFSLNIMWNKAQRLNNNMAVQHRQQTMTCKYWRMWRDRLEEVEDQRFQPLTQMCLTNYSSLLLRNCFLHWREKLAEQRHKQGMERRADIWFAERMLPQCFKSWVEFTLQRRLCEQRRHKAEVYNRQRQYAWVFYTWWGQSEKHREEMLSERMAILHEERCRMQTAWARWRQRTQQQIKEVETQEASHRLYLHRLLHKTVMQWKDNSTEIRDRRNREQQACRQGDLSCMRWAVEKWKKFVQSQRVKKSRLQQIQHYHEVKLLKHSLMTWKKHHLQMSQIYEHAEELHRQKTLCFLRKVLTAWRENAALLAEVRVAERRAQNHFQHFFQLKVFLVWREATTHAVSKRHQQGEALRRAQMSMNQVRLLRYFRQWRKQTREARRERVCMEKARRHHNSKLLSTNLKAWKRHHYQHQKKKVMKRQGILLLRLRMCQTYFEQWKIKLQHRRREAKQTERALWHWSLTLQAKVLYGWRLWVTEQRRNQEQAARAAEVYRDHLLREGVTRILTYAAHMNDLTTSLTQHSQEQRSQHLQRVVKRYAMRWKQRALRKPRREQEVRAQPPRKSVTFCLTAPNSVASSDSAEQGADDGGLSELLLTRTTRRQPRRWKELFEYPLKVSPQSSNQNQSVITSTEAVPRPFEFNCPQIELPASSYSLCPDKVSVPSTHQSTLISTVSPSEAHVSTVDSPQETQNRDLLLPPSAFMTTATQNMLRKSSSSGPRDAPHVPFHHVFTSFKHRSSTYPEVHLRASSGETEVRHAEPAAADPASALTEELLSIQLDMKNFQQSRKQLRAWRKLKEVLQSWLQTSGKDEEMERNAVCQELKELEEHIDRLSTELEKWKPTMLLHANRVQRLQSVRRKTEEMETDNCVLTT
ncbi:protein SFI1 homolog isoform X1 [Embiotoca jacksoni]|uniref:protein SFI1 homolog isoform X1 n=1 Tax=Embiotoca jacksoni TaxID=100190 RepID=UPI003704C163